MTTDKIVNAAPMSIMLGINDQSTKAVEIEAEALPTFLAKMPFFAKWGPTIPQLVGGNGLSQMYHADTLDLRKKWANHATVMLSNIVGAGALVMGQRMVPDDAPKPSTLRFFADVLPKQIQQYVKNPDGSIKTDGAGNPVPAAGKAAGFQVKYVVKEVELAEDGTDTFGLAVIEAGDQVDGETQSQRIPLFDLEVPHQGDHGKNMGLRIWAPTLKSSNPLDDRTLGADGFYGFRMACFTRTDVSSTGTVVNTQDGEQYIDVALKPGAFNSAVETEVYVGDKFIDSYQRLNDPVYPDSYGPFGRMSVYQDNIDQLLAQFQEAEAAVHDDNSDFKNDDSDMYRFNLFGGQTSAGTPYNTFVIVTGTANSVALNDSSTIYALGGGDGTLSDAKFAELVSAMAKRYNDETDEFTDMALYPESVLLDSGYPLATKYDLLNFIGSRKDTAVFLATYEAGARKLTASEESALAIALRTRAKNYPESEFFGTEVVRCAIFGRHGKLLNSQWKGQLPLIHEFAAKAAAYMGAGNGIWKAANDFSSGDLAQVTMFTDINVTFTPASVRNKDWANGLNWVESFQRKSVYFPAFKTVYGNDTSVLTNIFTMLICVQVQKVADRVRKEFSGNSKLTPGQLCDAINKRVIELTEGRFDGRATIIPRAYVTGGDQKRGFSWTLPVGVYTNTMHTVGTISVESFRTEDLPQ